MMTRMFVAPFVHIFNFTTPYLLYAMLQNTLCMNVGRAKGRAKFHKVMSTKDSPRPYGPPYEPPWTATSARFDGQIQWTPSGQRTISIKRGIVSMSSLGTNCEKPAPAAGRHSSSVPRYKQATFLVQKSLERHF